METSSTSVILQFCDLNDDASNPPETITLNRMLTQIMDLLVSFPFLSPPKDIYVRFLTTLLNVERRCLKTTMQFLINPKLQYLSNHFLGVVTLADADFVVELCPMRPLVFSLLSCKKQLEILLQEDRKKVRLFKNWARLGLCLYEFLIAFPVEHYHLFFEAINGQKFITFINFDAMELVLKTALKKNHDLSHFFEAIPDVTVNWFTDGLYFHSDNIRNIINTFDTLKFDNRYPQIATILKNSQTKKRKLN